MNLLWWLIISNDISHCACSVDIRPREDRDTVLHNVAECCCVHLVNERICDIILVA